MARSCDIDAGTIRRVDWLELVPATLFFRAFAATFKPSFLLLCALFALACGYFNSQIGAVDLNGCYACLDRPNEVPVADVFRHSLDFSSSPARAIFAFFRNLTPGVQASSFVNSKAGVAVFYIRCVEFLVALWLALAVARTAVVRLTTSSRSSTFASLKFALKRYPSALLTVVAPLCFSLTLLLLSFTVKLIPFVGAIFSPFVMLFVFALEFILALFILSASLGVAAIGAENCDGFDALSRSVSYLVQRTLIWLLYAAIAQFLICIGTAILAIIAQYASLAYFSCYSVDGNFGGGIGVEFWGLLILQIPRAYPYVAFVVYSCAIYVMLRRSVDGTPFETCALNLKGTTLRKLRKILKDGKGAPTFDQQTASMHGDTPKDAATSERGGDAS